jgi:hypothetical protein
MIEEEEHSLKLRHRRDIPHDDEVVPIKKDA